MGEPTVSPGPPSCRRSPVDSEPLSLFHTIGTIISHFCLFVVTFRFVCDRPDHILSIYNQIVIISHLWNSPVLPLLTMFSIASHAGHMFCGITRMKINWFFWSSKHPTKIRADLWIEHRKLPFSSFSRGCEWKSGGLCLISFGEYIPWVMRKKKKKTFGLRSSNDYYIFIDCVTDIFFNSKTKKKKNKKWELFQAFFGFIQFSHRRPPFSLNECEPEPIENH